MLDTPLAPVYTGHWAGRAPVLSINSDGQGMNSEVTKYRKSGPNGVAGVIRDLTADGLLPLDDGERLWKLYIFRPEAGRATGLEHRIYTKIKPGGNLALVTFAMHTPAAGQAARSGIARVPDISVDALDHIIDVIRRETQTGADEYTEIDLTKLPSWDEQLAYLQRLGAAS